MYYHHNQEDNRKNTAHVSTSLGDSETEADYRVGTGQTLAEHQRLCT